MSDDVFADVPRSLKVKLALKAIGSAPKQLAARLWEEMTKELYVTGYNSDERDTYMTPDKRREVMYFKSGGGSKLEGAVPPSLIVPALEWIAFEAAEAEKVLMAKALLSESKSLKALREALESASKRWGKVCAVSMMRQTLGSSVECDYGEVDDDSSGDGSITAHHHNAPKHVPLVAWKN